jgi:hypothetical protein
MRKIISKEETKRKEKIKNRIIGISLLSIMVLSVFGIVVDSIGKTDNSANQLTYRGTDFFNQQERWFFTKGGIDYSIVNSPENLTEISMENISLIASYSGKPLYISSFDKSLESEIYYNFNKITYRIQYGCLNESKCDGDFPVKTCNDNFIILEEDNETSITQEQNCVFIKSTKEEIQKAVDAFFLKITGIN